MPVEIKQRDREEHDAETITFRQLPLRLFEQPARDHHKEEDERQPGAQTSRENERQHRHPDHGVRKCPKIRPKTHKVLSNKIRLYDPSNLWLMLNFDLKQAWPEFASHKQFIARQVVGDSIQHRFRIP